MARALARESQMRDVAVRKLAAFLGRYGRQPASDVMAMPITFAIGLADDIAELMREEKEQSSRE